MLVDLTKKELDEIVDALCCEHWDWNKRDYSWLLHQRIYLTIIANFYRIEELTTEGWTLIEDQAAKVTKEKCDELLVQYINRGQNPNRLRAVAVQDVWTPSKRLC